MSESHFDVVVIGGGPGGYASALYGASAGLNIALIERHKVGGTCLNVGCIPAKELLETAAVNRAVQHAEEFGVLAESRGIDWTAALKRKQGIVDQLVGGLSSVLKGRKVTVFEGNGSLGSDHRTVSISGGESGDVVISGDAIILATGSLPRTIPGFPIDDRRIVTSTELLSIPELPESAVVIGGGAIGCEFASMMADLGTKVTIVEAAPNILLSTDKHCRRMVERSFKKRKIDIHTSAMVTGQETTDAGVVVSFGEGQQVTAQTVVISIGRVPVTEGLGLENTQVQLDERGFIVGDEIGRTAAPKVYAVGDVIDTAQLAHIAFVEGMNVIKDILGEPVLPVNYDTVPWCVYCHPEVAFAGLTEEQANERGIETVSSMHRYNANGRAMIVGEAEGIVKVVAKKNSDGTAGTIIGVHMVGPWVTEQLGQGYLAVNWEATVEEAASFIQPHPTLSETFGETVMALTGRSLH